MANWPSGAVGILVLHHAPSGIMGTAVVIRREGLPQRVTGLRPLGPGCPRGAKTRVRRFCLAGESTDEAFSSADVGPDHRRGVGWDCHCTCSAAERRVGLGRIAGAGVGSRDAAAADVGSDRPGESAAGARTSSDADCGASHGGSPRRPRRTVYDRVVVSSVFAAVFSAGPVWAANRRIACHVIRHGGGRARRGRSRVVGAR
jgi:hypothetical protein